MADRESDAQVVARSLLEPEAFGEIYDRHAATLLRFLVRRVGPEPAESLLGELFRIGFERRSSFDTARDSARPWLYGVASNLLLKHRRNEARRLRANAGLAAEPSAEDANERRAIDTADARALLPRVAEAIAELPDGERNALLLFVWEELGYDDIAAALEIPVGTVRSRLNRARGRLRELASALGKQRDEPTSHIPGKRR